MGQHKAFRFGRFSALALKKSVQRAIIGAAITLAALTSPAAAWASAGCDAVNNHELDYSVSINDTTT
ncbi:hypothetical protein ABTM82_19480, partial [Acinetobacter baumannii]